MKEARVIESDVCVIGGGMAGCFAAIKASEAGAQVVLVDKGYVSSSGQTPYANSFLVYDSAKHDFGTWMNQINVGGDYLNKRDWTEIVLKESMQAYLDLVSFGIETVTEDDGTVRERGLAEIGPCTAIFPNMKDCPRLLREQTTKCGVKIYDRIMVVELLKDKKGRVAGAVGISVSEADPIVFKAKNIIMCTGAAGFKPTGWPIGELTADGDTMAYRAGASITGKEFVDPHNTSLQSPAYIGPIFLKRPSGNPPPPPRFTNAEGEDLQALTFHLGPEFEAHAGRLPLRGRVYSSLPNPEGGLMPSTPTELCGGASAGMSTHKSEGIWSVGLKGCTDLPGLYAAGDSLGAMLSGAAYSAIGIALTGSAVMGAIAGREAAEEAKTLDVPDIDQRQIDSVFEEIFYPLRRQGGFKPAWVIQLLQNTMIPYYIGIIKKENRLLAALNQIEFYRDHLVPMLRASDAHELRLALEIKNMICNAEMKLKASLMRKESRGTHYREDYPTRDDENWLAWIKIKNDNGKMLLMSEPIPNEWRRKKNESYMFEFPTL
jgi:succinate dehydrogenase/fumarate reductase flavoprotein subunit